MKRLQTKKRESVAFDYEKDGSSNEGMQTSVWGPILWTFLHIMSFNYPVQPTEEDKIHYKGFVEHLQYILPCKKCRENLPKNMIRARYGDQCFKNRKEFSQFFWRLFSSFRWELLSSFGPFYKHWWPFPKLFSKLVSAEQRQQQLPRLRAWFQLQSFRRHLSWLWWVGRHSHVTSSQHCCHHCQDEPLHQESGPGEVVWNGQHALRLSCC